MSVFTLFSAELSENVPVLSLRNVYVKTTLGAAVWPPANSASKAN